ncbi:hypothetical protein Tco_0133715 [Tanacetum coccineum]
MTNVFNKVHSTVRRSINNKTTTKNSNFNQRVNTVKDINVNVARPKVVVNTAKPKAVLNAVKGNDVNDVKASACWVWKPKTKGNPQQDLEEKGIDGGYVAFGENPKGGKIIGKDTQSNGFACTKASDNAVLKSSHDDGSKPSSDDGKKVDEDPRKDSKCKDQEKEDNVNNTNNVNTAGNADGINKVNAVGEKTSIKLPFDLNMSALEDDSIFDFLRDDEDDGVVADMNNLDTTIQVSPNPTI